MSQVCRQCSRINPADAAYCYFDGAVLAATAGSGPVNAGSAPFPGQFVFPSGQVCKNFDQLALACQQNWQSAVDLLKQGFLSSFFGGLGRADLAMAAMEAAKFPDADRGLDQLLSKLPTHVLQEPKLKAEPGEINLGQAPLGVDRNSEIHLHNHGMRLLYGSVVSDCKWLAFGEGQGSGQKLFQFGSDAVIPVHIKGQHLRAGTKPLEGHLVIESNGGSATITFRADVPIKPFQGGLFDGCKTPRQVAEKAKANPKEAGPIFESGAVAKWFESNGWSYPVQGPSASGLGGVQQFFEALGLAKAPKVTVNPQSLSFRGDGGLSLASAIEVSTAEKKPVYAYATCDQAWVDCSRVKLAGRNATITVSVARVPNRPGETLQATIKVMGNGNQKFNVPLALTIDKADPNPLPEPIPIVGAPAVSPAVIQQVEAPFAALTMAAGPNEVVATPTDGPMPIAQPPGQQQLPPPVLVATVDRRKHRPLWVHLTPLVLLLLALMGVLGWDAFGPAPAGSGGSIDPIDQKQRLGLLFDFDPKIQKQQTFGVVMLEGAQSYKKLTYDEKGRTNSTVLLIDGQERTLGNPNAGKWENSKAVGKYGGRSGDFKFTGDHVVVTQHVEVVPGESIEIAPGVSKRFMDTVLVRYKIRNIDSKPRKVGLRVMIDTYIGSNDGVPFTVAGGSKLVSTSEDFNPNDLANKKPIPDFVQAHEFEDLSKPGTIVLVNFRIGDKIEPPGRVSLTHWPNFDGLRKYEVPIDSIRDDSAVAMYWTPRDMPSNSTRDVGFTYGLGNVSAQSDKIGLVFGGNLVVRGELSVVALIAEPQPGQTATLELPAGAFTPVDSQLTQIVPPSTEKTADGRPRPSPVTWRLRADRDGSFSITVRTSNGLQATRRITIKRSSVF